MQGDGLVDRGVAAGRISSDIDEVLVFAVNRQMFPPVGRQFDFIGRQQIPSQAADAIQHVDRGIMVLGGEFARQHDMPIQDGPH